MIVDSGWGLNHLMFRDEADRESWELRIVCLDAELHPLVSEKISDRYLGSLDQHAEEIRSRVEREHVKYFVVGHRVADSDPHRDFSHHYSEERDVIDALEELGYQFLGHQVHDGEWWGSSGPMYQFHSYLGGENMPRVVIIPGPHPFDCECAFCGPCNARIAAGRATASN